MYEFRPRDPNLRAGDADREAIFEQLRRHHAEGRLDAEEFQQRIDACYHAKTMGELHGLLSDLPRDERDRPANWPWAGGRGLRYWRLAAFPLIPILITLLVLGSIAHHGFGALFIIVPLFFLAKMWMWRRGVWGWRRYGPGPRL